MMISPEGFATMQREKSYVELLEVRDELIDDIRAFEEGPAPSFIISPSPEVIYKMNLEYLKKTCELILVKYNEEFGCKLDEKPEEIDEEISSGAAAFLVRGKEVGMPDSPFWNRLYDEGFKAYRHCKGHYDNVDWAWVNVNSKVFARGMPGIRITASIGNHAITVDEFWSIVDIYKKYEGKDPIVMD